MTARKIKETIIKAFKNKYLFWFGVRIVSTGGPLLITYIFAKGIEAIETFKPFNDIVFVFLILLLVQISENLLRIASKSRLVIYTEHCLITIQENLVSEISPEVENRKEEIQAIRNLTQAVRRFSDYAKDNGITGVVSLISIPTILFFVDKRIFALEMFLIFIYLTLTYIFSKFYEKRYEDFDRSRENYFAKIIVSNEVFNLGEEVKSTIARVQNLAFLGWLNFQNINALFQFVVVYIIAKDIVNGTKQISDLILIVGYTKESQIFLNSLTIMLERLMQVKAGIERLVDVSNNPKVSSLV